MGRKPKFSKEVKIQACKSHEKGNGSFESIAKEVGCTESIMRLWYQTYSIHGSKTFDSNHTNRSYSKAFKISIVESYLSGEYSLSGLSAKYMIAYSMVQRWVNTYNNGIELKTYDPKSEVYTMKSKRTTFEERLEIVNWVIANGMNYKEAASKFQIKYALVYKWTREYMKDGAEALKYKKRGPKSKSVVAEGSLSEIEQLKLALEREQALRKRAEFELEVLKKKEEFERKNRFRK
jgi:transposase-like protein